MKRVLVLHREHLLAGGIASLLSHAEDIDVVAVGCQNIAEFGELTLGGQQFPPFGEFLD